MTLADEAWAIRVSSAVGLGAQERGKVSEGGIERTALAKGARDVIESAER